MDDQELIQIARTMREHPRMLTIIKSFARGGIDKDTLWKEFESLQYSAEDQFLGEEVTKIGTRKIKCTRCGTYIQMNALKRMCVKCRESS